MSKQLKLSDTVQAARPSHSVRPKSRLTESGTDLVTIFRCFLSFQIVVTTRNTIVFKIKFSRPKTAKKQPSDS
jgi:hypothetical protein